jgi:outer membrane lipoprotein-sorting protein
MRLNLTISLLVCAALAGAQTDLLLQTDAPLKTAKQVLDRYTQALGGRDAIEKVQSMTVQGEAERGGAADKSVFIYYAKPFKSLFKLTRPDGTQVSSGFDGKVGWLITPQGTKVDKDSDLDANLRDADLQYPLHQSDYFKQLELAGVTDFEGHRCYWLHGTTNWGRDNNQFYDVDSGLLVGNRFESDDASKTITIELYQDYKNLGGGRLFATKTVARNGDHIQTYTYKAISYDPIDDSIFDLPSSVKAALTKSDSTKSGGTK